MTLEEVIAVMEEAESRQQMTVRLHTGDPSLYGAIREQIDCLKEQKIAYDVTPRRFELCGAAAALDAEYTLPGITQSVIITRMAGRTPVSEAESIASLAAHGCAMVIFLERRDAGGTTARAVKGRLHGADTGSDCIQGKLAGRAHAALSAGKTCPVRKKKPAYPKQRL